MKTNAQQNTAAAARLEGSAIVGLMRKYRVTMRDLKAKHCITLKRIREVRANGVSGFLAQEWVWLITGHWPDEAERQ